MVSALWKACSDGHLEVVQEILKDASSVDIEIKDHTGVTPLIEGIKNGHVEVVRALLEKGADPTNASSQGPPQQYTSDPEVLNLLIFAQNQMGSNGPLLNGNVYNPEANGEAEKSYYSDAAYTYYPTINSQPPPLPEGAVYYPQPPSQSPQDPASAGAAGNLPPPDIARFIPCRYFPACRYGASCLFAHPQAPYFQGPLPPPAQYPAPYDPMVSPPYPQGYYAMPPPSFQPPNGVHQMSALPSPPPPSMNHNQSQSEIMSAPTHFSPNGGPPPMPYGAISPMMSPSAYPHPGQVPVPMSIPSLPPLHHQAPSGPQSPPAMYAADTAPPFPVQSNGIPQYPPAMAPGPVYPIVNGNGNGITKSPPLNPQPDSFAPGPGMRDMMGHNRRGTGRRPSFVARKPPCLFFPAGRCKNGDDCRFPHVMPEAQGHQQPAYFAGRGGGPRPRGHMNGNGHAYGAIDEKLAGLQIRDEQPSRVPNGTENSSRSHSTDPGNRPRFPQGPKNNHLTNGHQNKRVSAAKQRVPNADEFPVLAGATTPPARSPGSSSLTIPNGWTNGYTNGTVGPTAAQVLQAPPPFRKDSVKEGSTRDVSPEPTKAPQEQTVELNGVAPEQTPEAPPIASKLPISFAAVANASATADITREVSVSA